MSATQSGIVEAEAHACGPAHDKTGRGERDPATRVGPGDHGDVHRRRHRRGLAAWFVNDEGGAVHERRQAEA